MIRLEKNKADCGSEGLENPKAFSFTFQLNPIDIGSPVTTDWSHANLITFADHLLANLLLLDSPDDWKYNLRMSFVSVRFPHKTLRSVPL